MIHESEFQQPLDPDQPYQFRLIQIIVGALMMGLMFFFLIALFITLGKKPENPSVSYLIPVMAVMELMGWFIVSRSLTNNYRQKINRQFDWRSLNEVEIENVFYPGYQTLTIIEFALMEGVGFFSCISFIIEAQTWVPIVVGVILLAMVVLFPTRNGFQNWVRTQRELMELNH